MTEPLKTARITWGVCAGCGKPLDGSKHACNQTESETSNDSE